MKNKEKYYEEVLKEFVEGTSCSFKRKYVLKKGECRAIECSQCREKTIQWLNAEYKEPIRLRKNEKVILESLSKKWKWIARDSNYNLDVYSDKPHKDEVCWYDVGGADFYFFKHLFQFIKWEDEEPYSIEELLKCEVIDNEC